MGSAVFNYSTEKPQNTARQAYQKCDNCCSRRESKRSFNRKQTGPISDLQRASLQAAGFSVKARHCDP